MKHQLTPAQHRALEIIQGAGEGKVTNPAGVRLSTLRALARHHLIHLESLETVESTPGGGTRPRTNWTAVLIERKGQEITDAELAELPAREADLLRPLGSFERYTALREAHIRHHRDATGRTRAEILAEVIPAMFDREPGDRPFVSLAAHQWRCVQRHEVNYWDVRGRDQRAAMIVEARTKQEAEERAHRIVQDNPEQYPELQRVIYCRRMMLGELDLSRRFGDLARLLRHP